MANSTPNPQPYNRRMVDAGQHPPWNLKPEASSTLVCNEALQVTLTCGQANIMAGIVCSSSQAQANADAISYYETLYCSPDGEYLRSPNPGWPIRDYGRFGIIAFPTPGTGPYDPTRTLRPVITNPDCINGGPDCPCYGPDCPGQGGGPDIGTQPPPGQPPPPVTDDNPPGPNNPPTTPPPVIPPGPPTDPDQPYAPIESEYLPPALIYCEGGTGQQEFIYSDTQLAYKPRYAFDTMGAESTVTVDSLVLPVGFVVDPSNRASHPDELIPLARVIEVFGPLTYGGTVDAYLYSPATPPLNDPTALLYTDATWVELYKSAEVDGQLVSVLWGWALVDYSEINACGTVGRCDWPSCGRIIPIVIPPDETPCGCALITRTVEDPATGNRAIQQYIYNPQIRPTPFWYLFKASQAPCGGCPVTPTVELSVVSRQGSGYFCGFTGYRPDGNVQANLDPTAPWNAGPVYKYKTKTLGGGFNSSSFSALCGGFFITNVYAFGGATEWGCGVPVAFGNLDTTTFSKDSFCNDTKTSTTQSALNATIIAVGSYTASRELSSAEYTNSLLAGMSTEVLGDEDTLFDALGRGVHTVAALTTACIGTVTPQDPESLANRNVTGATAVQYTAEVTSLIPLVPYVATFSFDNSPDVVVGFTPSGTSVTIGPALVPLPSGVPCNTLLGVTVEINL